MEETKKCGICKKEKYISDFDIYKGKISFCCKECYGEYINTKKKLEEYDTSSEIKEKKDIVMDDVKKALEEKKLLRNNIEKLVLSAIRSGKEINQKDLNDIFALSYAINTLETLMN